MTIEVRRARPGDELAVAAVHVRGWQVGYHGLLPAEGLAGLDPAARAQRYTFDADRPATFVGLTAGQIAGFVTIGEADREDALGGMVYAIYVDPDHWGQGLGQALIAVARRALGQWGFARACLWVLAGNDRAEGFYRADGWEHDGVVRTETLLGQDVSELRFVRQL